ncbi:hypothetical protein [Saccharopolyspora shandongensis]|uniref:hypothetical protein n=1 Tax=Saccharopolyspora shandongensis TaxID=418495 RepID=UPI003F4DD7F8
MSNDTTLVLGATGKTGRRVAARLRLRGTPVRAASRSSRTPFDWSDPAGWDPALRGIATAYIVPPAVPGPVHDFVTQAEAAGVQHREADLDAASSALIKGTDKPPGGYQPSLINRFMLRRNARTTTSGRGVWGSPMNWPSASI